MPEYRVSLIRTEKTQMYHYVEANSKQEAIEKAKEEPDQYCFEMQLENNDSNFEAEYTEPANTFCRQRRDLIGLDIPIQTDGQVIHVQINNWYPCWQPDYLDNEEFNVRVDWDGQEIFAQSIDLEFK